MSLDRDILEQKLDPVTLQALVNELIADFRVFTEPILEELESLGLDLTAIPQLKGAQTPFIGTFVAATTFDEQRLIAFLGTRDTAVLPISYVRDSEAFMAGVRRDLQLAREVVS